MIEVRSLTRRFGREPAVDDAHLQVSPGETVAVTGASGSGKTTLLRLVAGLDLPDGGEVSIDGRVASRAGWALEPRLRGIGFLFQVSALWPHMTVEQNIMFGLHRSPAQQSRERAGDLLRQVGLEGFAHRRPHELSGGEARRVALARSLAPRPRYLLLDEPLVHLDPETKERMLALIRDAAAGAGVIYVTHDPEEAADVSTRQIYMKNGRLME